MSLSRLKPIEVTVLESRFEHPSEYLFDRETVNLEVDAEESRLLVTKLTPGERFSLRLSSHPFDPLVPVCEPMCLMVLPGFTKEGYEADWHIYPAPSCSRTEFESLLTELNKIGWPTVRL